MALFFFIFLFIIMLVAIFSDSPRASRKYRSSKDYSYETYDCCEDD